MTPHRIARHDEIDPEIREGLRAYVEAFGPGGLDAIVDLDLRRARYAELIADLVAGSTPNPAVRSEDRLIPRDDPEEGEIRVRVYEPTERSGPLPALVLMHGGGLILGTLEVSELSSRAIVDAVGCVIVSVDYRLAPEHPYPAGLDDSYRALTWTAEEADGLGIDRGRIGLYGASAGGCLAIGTALLARDRGGPPVTFLMTPYPMLDDRNETPSSHAILDFGAWDRAANLEAWRYALGDAAGGEGVSPYAAPARATDLAGLPPTYIDVGDLDLFRDEDVTFALGLMEAGVPTELKVYPGVIHSGEAFAPHSQISKRILADRWAALRRALHPGVDDSA